MIEVIQGDITECTTDAIVNAANTTLLGGGGVDGAIHRAAGPELLEACRLLDGCATGDAKLTKGYRLPAHYVIHTVGPIWRGGKSNEDELLVSCYQRSLELASQHGIKSMAFPSISTGVYRFPYERAARIAVGTVQNYLVNHEEIEEVVFVCFDERGYRIYQELIPDSDR